MSAFKNVDLAPHPVVVPALQVGDARNIRSGLVFKAFVFFFSFLFLSFIFFFFFSFCFFSESASQVHVLLPEEDGDSNTFRLCAKLMVLLCQICLILVIGVIPDAIIM